MCFRLPVKARQTWGKWGKFKLLFGVLDWLGEMRDRGKVQATQSGCELEGVGQL